MLAPTVEIVRIWERKLLPSRKRATSLRREARRDVEGAVPYGIFDRTWFVKGRKNGQGVVTLPVCNLMDIL